MTKLVMDFETAYGADPASKAGKILSFVSCGIVKKQPLNSSNAINGSDNPTKPVLGMVDVAGPLVYPVDLNGVGYLLKGIFGAPTTTGAGPDYTHVFKTGVVAPSMVFSQEHSDIGQYLKYNGCKFDKFSFAYNNANLTLNIDAIGSKQTVGTAAYDASATTVVLDEFAPPQVTLEEGGSAITIATALELAFARNLESGDYPIGLNGLRSEPAAGTPDISGSVEAIFQDAALLTKTANGTPSSLKVLFTKAANKSLEIYLPEILYHDPDTAVTGPQGLKLKIGYTGYYSSNADTTSFKVTLKNQTASYA